MKHAANGGLGANNRAVPGPHLLSNGMLTDVLLFGSFLAWAVWDRISLKRRAQQPIATAPPGRFNDLIAVIAGLALYAFFVLWAHMWLLGVSPLG